MNEKISVVEVCPHCGEENELLWDFDRHKLTAFCPVCGGVMMLCDECMHREDTSQDCTPVCDGHCSNYDPEAKYQRGCFHKGEPLHEITLTTSMNCFRSIVVEAATASEARNIIDLFGEIHGFRVDGVIASRYQISALGKPRSHVDATEYAVARTCGEDKPNLIAAAITASEAVAIAEKNRCDLIFAVDFIGGEIVCIRKVNRDGSENYQSLARNRVQENTKLPIYLPRKPGKATFYVNIEYKSVRTVSVSANSPEEARRIVDAYEQTGESLSAVDFPDERKITVSCAENYTPCGCKEFDIGMKVKDKVEFLGAFARDTLDAARKLCQEKENTVMIGVESDCYGLETGLELLHGNLDGLGEGYAEYSVEIWEQNSDEGNISVPVECLGVFDSCEEAEAFKLSYKLEQSNVCGQKIRITKSIYDTYGNLIDFRIL